MKIHRMTASFGCLENEALTLGDGLNLIEAPNESGKSTWVAFLRAMLYGLSTRERGALADKNRYAPWSGAPMSGRMDLTCGGQEITLTRTTARANAPMGSFSATRTGTGDAVDALSATACGETLLGVPRSVFERSAFIRQSGLAIEQDAELERRIAALITTGEEDTSYSEAARRLKEQLNRRRVNSRVGQIPELERQIAETETALHAAQAAQARLRGAKERLRQMQAEKQKPPQSLGMQGFAGDCADTQNLGAQGIAENCADTQNLGTHGWTEDGARAQSLGAQWVAGISSVEDGRARQREVLLGAKATGASLLPLRQTLADEQRQLAETALASKKLQEKAAAHPLAGATPAEVRASHRVETGRKPSKGVETALQILSIFCVFFCIFAFFFKKSAIFAVFALVFFAVAGALFYPNARRRKNAAAAAQAQEDAFAAQLEEYTALYEDWQSAENARREAELKCDAFARTLREGEARLFDLLRPLGRFTDADEALRFTDRALAALAAEESLRAQHAAALTAAAREVDVLQGQLASFDSPADLAAALQTLTESREMALGEYDAITLAMEMLESANATLQNRFSPRLGARAAEIFAALTGGKYDRVVLDRTLQAAAEEAGVPVSREAALLSQGAADQLYLAVRLAICELVLPEEESVPLVLDDALTNFDDERMGYALDFLCEEAKTRQILLFTCQSREAAYLRRRPGVTLLRLAKSGAV